MRYAGAAARAVHLPPAHTAVVGTPTTSVHVGFLAGFDVTWMWDAASGTWKRSIFGSPEILASGAQFAPKNVVVMFVQYVGGDPNHGNEGAEAVITGHGTAVVFTAGKEIVGTWSRPDKNQPAQLARRGRQRHRAHARSDLGRAPEYRLLGHENSVAGRRTPGSRLSLMANDRTIGERTTGTARVKRGLAEMLRGGVIMDVVDAQQAKIAEDAGAVAVMALERVPSDIRRDGGVARMSDPSMIEGIQKAVTVPVMAKCRIGHFAEAQVLQALGVDYVDESEVLTPADEAHHVDKWQFTVPFVCGATNLGEALRRIGEGACLIRSKGEAGTGNIVEAVRHLRSILGDIERIKAGRTEERYAWAKELRAPVDLVEEVAERGELPVPLFCAGGIATPADAALVMQLGAQSVFVGSGIFKSEDPSKRARAIVEATTHYEDADIVAKVSRGLGGAMRGEEIDTLDVKLAERGW